MNILFLSLGEFDNLEAGSVHIDILRRLSQDHNVYLVCKRERRQNLPTECREECGIHVLRVKVGNLKNVNIIEKGVSTILVELQFLRAIKVYLAGIRFDLVIYSTPPVTFAKVVDYIKKRDHAKSYLMLKDIFPQNAVDLGMLKKNGMKGIIYRFFRRQEQSLYSVSDFIGCMSPANCSYILEKNPEVEKEKVGLCPNGVYIKDMSVSKDVREKLRKKYALPLDKKIFIYGGNLGRPQGIPFLIDCLNAVKERSDGYFLIIGKGTEYGKLERYMQETAPQNVKLFSSLPQKEYDTLAGACDVGLIFLDHRFEIPNFPARTLSYMQAKLPILACTDPNTDIGRVIVDGGFGWWCESDDPQNFVSCVDQAVSTDLSEMKEKEWDYLNKNFSIDRIYESIMDFMQKA